MDWLAEVSVTQNHQLPLPLSSSLCGFSSPSQVSQHSDGQWFRQLQPEHGVLRAVDHPVQALHHLPLQEEAKEPPR